MKPIHSFAYLVVIYLLVQALGLAVGAGMITGIKEGVIEPAVPQGESPKTSINIFAYVVAFTAVLLILFKLGLDIIITVVTYFALYAGVFITFTTLMGDAGFIASIPYYITSLILRKNTVISNLTLVFTIAGIGGFLGASLAVFPALLLILILSAYDLIAVFGTKHMVTLATKAKGKIPFMFLIPVKDRQLGLGTGDLTIPLVFTVSVLRDYTLAHATLTSLGGLAGLTILFNHALKKEGTPLPALPPITIGLFLGYMTSLIL
ncbi:MAG: presenilin family intramembrane aspartyl protease [Candidatus Altiarchaeota archaeon]